MRRILAILCALAAVGFAAPVLAQSAPDYTPSAGAGLLTTAESTGAYDTEGSSLIATSYAILQGILATLGIVFVVLMVYAGILYLTAQGEAARVEKAKSIITSSIIGIVIIVVSYAAVNFILNVLFFSQEDPAAYQEYRQEQISTICTNQEACGSDPLCFGTPECQEIAANKEEVFEFIDDPCNFDATSEACIEQRAPQTLELCDAQPDLPLCCALYDDEDPRWSLYCSRVIQSEDDLPAAP